MSARAGIVAALFLWSVGAAASAAEHKLTIADTILEAFADRAAIEQDFHDIKEVHGAGQQQVRHYWANIARRW